MKPEFEPIELIKTDQRFELPYQGYTAFIEYVNRDDKIALIHTEAPKELQGTGAAGALVEKTLSWLKKNKVEAIPLCPYIKKFIIRNPEWKEIVAEPFRSNI